MTEYRAGVSRGGPPGDAVDWGSILAVIGAVGAVEDADAFGRVAMEAVADVVACDSASYNEVDTSVGQAAFRTHPHDLDVGSADVEAFPVLVGQNPILRYEEATGDGSARRISDFITSGELHDLELYRRVYGPLGVEFQAAFALATKQPLIIAFALNRHEADFTDPELDVLDVLRPHLVQAYRNLRALAALRGMERGLAEVGKGVVVLGSNGVDEWSSSWAHRVITEHFGPAPAGTLPYPVETWLAQQRQHRFDDGRPRIHEPLVSVAGDRQLAIRYVPGKGDRPQVLVLDERAPDREVTELQRLGLTPRESQILLMVARGESTVGAARRLGVSTGTLSKHLQNIYRKLGVTSRTAAAAAASDAIFSAR